MRLLGIGITGLEKLYALLHLPLSVFQKSYDLTIKTNKIPSDIVCSFAMKNTAKKEKKISVEKGENNGFHCVRRAKDDFHRFSELFRLSGGTLENLLIL